MAGRAVDVERREAEETTLRVLDDAGRRVQAMWKASLDSSDFDLVTRLLEAGQAIERAKLALAPERATRR